MNAPKETISLQFVSYAAILFKAEIYAKQLTIVWGDGEISNYCNEEYYPITHLYRFEGVQKIKISGENITYLSISHQMLKELTLENSPALEYLNCSGNELFSLNLNGCASLEELYCNSNNLENLHLPDIHNIYLLNASYNNLKMLELRNCHALQTLYCSNNKLKEVDFSSCNSINEINISHNSLGAESMDSLFRQLPAKQNKNLALICYIENPGLEDCDRTIVVEKKWC